MSDFRSAVIVQRRVVKVGVLHQIFNWLRSWPIPLSIILADRNIVLFIDRIFAEYAIGERTRQVMEQNQ